jgi:nucleotide-binding universal stress UspA family protein
MKVLLATDGSAQSDTAIRTAARILRKKESSFDLLCVAPEYSLSKERAKGVGQKKRSRMVEAYRQQIELEARKRLVLTQAALRTEGIEAGIKIVIGSPARVIVDTAAAYDVTVVGAHDRYTKSKAGLGPVASRIVAAAPGAVLVGRELTATRSWRILAPVDGSLAAENALNQMATFLRAESAEITLMHIVETPWIHIGLDREWFDYSEFAADRSVDEKGWENELAVEAESVIEDARRTLERHSLSANTIVAEGDPALEIVSEAENGDYDLIVMGATGGADLKHSLLGSVSTRVAQDAPCSVFVVR